MYASKAMGAWHLQCANATALLESRVLFSSVGSGLGNVGQASYATANASLDAGARSRRMGGGLIESSMQWPRVDGAGMGAVPKDVGDVPREKLASLASFTGMAGIALEEYAWCLGRQLSRPRSAAVQLVHRSDVDELLQDLADAAQPRFGELAAAATHRAARAFSPHPPDRPRRAAQRQAVRGGWARPRLAPGLWQAVQAAAAKGAAA